MYKIAIYTRVSTEEQAENPEGSIKNQELRLREFVKLKNMVAPFGEVAAVFSDPGVSAKDMNRPSFQKMLRAIERREVNLVLVTELSRFTRSMKDFSLLQEFLKKHGCEFLSMRENFDSSSATGNLVMTIMATLAEFERKQTAERISNSFHERAKRGLYNGGSVPLGYAIDEAKPGGLVIVPDEAELIRLVFATFLKEETLARTARRLNKDGVFFPRAVRGGGSPRGRIWRINMLYSLLRHRGYVGVRVFKDKKGGVHEASAAWEPIVNEEVFTRTQEMLARNCNRKRTHGTTRYPYTLSGVTFCRTCGHRLAGKSAHGRNGKIAYYAHSYMEKMQVNLAEKVNICDGKHRIQAVRIEPLVWQDVKEFLTSEGLAKELLASASALTPRETGKERLAKLEGALKKAEVQVEALAERIAALPRGLDPKALYAQLERLQGGRDAAALALEDAKKDVQPTDEYVSLESLQAFTEGLRKQLDLGDTNPEIQAAIIRKIVHKIEVLPDGYEIFYHAGMNHYQAELRSTPGSAFLHFDELWNKKRPASSPILGRRGRPDFFVPGKNVAGSTLFLIGGHGETIDAQISKRPYPHDTIRFSPKSKERIFEVCQPLYSAGCSLREIEQKTGFAKTSIREALTSRGYTLRRATKGPKKSSARSPSMRSPVLPFGYDWLDGKLVIDPKEYRVVQKILQLWRKGQSARVIADRLNQQQIPTRMGKRWFHSSVNAVIKRHQQSKTKT